MPLAKPDVGRVWDGYQKLNFISCNLRHFQRIFSLIIFLANVFQRNMKKNMVKVSLSIGEGGLGATT